MTRVQPPLDLDSITIAIGIMRVSYAHGMIATPTSHALLIA